MWSIRRVASTNWPGSFSYRPRWDGHKLRRRPKRIFQPVSSNKARISNPHSETVGIVSGQPSSSGGPASNGQASQASPSPSSSASAWSGFLTSGQLSGGHAGVSDAPRGDPPVPDSHSSAQSFGGQPARSCAPRSQSVGDGLRLRSVQSTPLTDSSRASVSASWSYRVRRHSLTGFRS